MITPQLFNVARNIQIMCDLAIFLLLRVNANAKLWNKHL